MGKVARILRKGRKTGGQTVENQGFPTVQTPRFSAGTGCAGSAHSGCDLTAEQVTKALLCCCGDSDGDCKECLLFDPRDDDCACAERLKKEAVRIISAQTNKIKFYEMLNNMNRKTIQICLDAMEGEVRK